MERIALDIDACHLVVADLDLLGVNATVEFASHDQPVLVVVEATSSTTANGLVSGVPRQVWVIWQTFRGLIRNQEELRSISGVFDAAERISPHFRMMRPRCDDGMAMA
jgi:hypothetical protein